jgi:phosphoribosyl 1,2-cyclic phosphodiesterase
MSDTMGANITFHILGSSSQGNCALLETPGCRVLIDIGFPAKRLNELLEPTGRKLSDVDAVFITHEHSDHISGLAGLARHPQIQVFANRETARAAQMRLKFRPSWQFFETGSTFKFRDVEICTFSIPHDATDPVGFVFSVAVAEAPPRRLAWCTDLGYVPELVRERIRGADVLVLESNYDPDMLDRDHRRPEQLRTAGRHRDKSGLYRRHCSFRGLSASPRLHRQCHAIDRRHAGCRTDAGADRRRHLGRRHARHHARQH